MKRSVATDIKALFGSAVRDARLKKGWSQEAMADECGLHRTYIGSVERGERNVSIENVALIALALEVDVRELFSFGDVGQADE
jgi:transcriptional regulator with XRE-family HTH domain